MMTMTAAARMTISMLLVLLGLVGAVGRKPARALPRPTTAATPAAQGAGAGRSYDFGYRADGMMEKVTVSGTDYGFDYSAQGLLTERKAGVVSNKVTNRDTAGRPLEIQVTVDGGLYMDQAMGWQADSKLFGYAWAQNGSSLPGGQEYFTYNRRGQMLDEFNQYTDSTTEEWAYGFDPDKNFIGTGLGVRLAAERLENGSVAGDFDTGSWWVTDFDPFVRPYWEGLFDAHNAINNSWVFGYDEAGNQLARGLSDRGQNMTYDAFGRLVKIEERSASTGNGFDFQAVYDGLGRRIRTVEQPVAAGVASGTAKTVDSYFDPSVEFLELGVAVNGNRAWKVYGPDLGEDYGSMQGQGGLLAVVQESDGAVAQMLNDHFGTVQGRVEGSTLTWNDVKLNSYGMLPDGSLPELNTSSDLAAVTMWRGLRQDSTGLYWMGARYYDPASGRFLTPDPMGHEGSLSLYDYAGGDPINGIDPDGRLSTKFGLPNQFSLMGGDYDERPITMADVEDAIGMYVNIGKAIVEAPIRDGWTAIYGEDIDTRHSVSGSQRAWAVANTAINLIPAADVLNGAKYAVRGVGAVARAETFAAEETTTLYRGVNESHAFFEDAQAGIVRPNGGTATPLEHNIGQGGTLNSPYTSWTTDPDVAMNFALRPNGGGVVIEAKVPMSQITESPNLKGVFLKQDMSRYVSESEVLVRGQVQGVATKVKLP